MIRKVWVAIVLMIALFAVAFDRPVFAADLASGAKIFTSNCAACHLGGKNLVVAPKTLKMDALKQFGMDSLEAIQAQVTKGKGAMPAFKGRLTSEEIEAVSAYVLSQAEKGWS
ncbi:MAG: c-type cytochrome [Leptolyngbyaceae cyanobacterium bins.59]|nr:c-type cytochrome [Leptolyngbyaceae cyanobacterium bins.59]